MTIDLERILRLAEAVRKSHRSGWAADEYDYITCPAGIICEVRGIGSDQNVVLRKYIAAMSPDVAKQLVVRIRVLAEALQEVVSRLPNKETIECLKADTGLGHRKYQAAFTDEEIVHMFSVLKATKGETR
jgi:hypothetical protein